MRIEVLCTGDELLNGITADTNSPFFMGRLLFELGQRVERSTTVGDSLEAIREAIGAASQRADVVLVSGGLGPTADDLTVEAAAHAQGVGCVEDPQALAAIEKLFVQRGLALTPNNRKQARVPEGSEVVQNPVGAAPLFIQRLGHCTLFYVAGVPREYRHLVEHEVLPRIGGLLATRGQRVFRKLRLLRTVGLPESHLDARVAQLAPAHPRVRFGFRTQFPINDLELLAEAETSHEALELLEAASADCAAALAPFQFGSDQDTLEGIIHGLLTRRGETLAVAESCTGGSIAQLVTSVAGASDCFRGGAVTYVDELKRDWLGVSSRQLSTAGAVSGEVALEMARGVRQKAGASWGVSTTGIAGPSGGTADHPVGTVYCALSSTDFERCERLQVPGNRQQIQVGAAYLALNLLRQALASPRSP